MPGPLVTGLWMYYVISLRFYFFFCKMGPPSSMTWGVKKNRERKEHRTLNSDGWEKLSYLPYTNGTPNFF
jgi:hypothetical protein